MLMIQSSELVGKSKCPQYSLNILVYDKHIETIWEINVHGFIKYLFLNIFPV